MAHRTAALVVTLAFSLAATTLAKNSDKDHPANGKAKRPAPVRETDPDDSVVKLPGVGPVRPDLFHPKAKPSTGHGLAAGAQVSTSAGSATAKDATVHGSAPTANIGQDNKPAVPPVFVTPPSDGTSSVGLSSALSQLGNGNRDDQVGISLTPGLVDLSGKGLGNDVLSEIPPAAIPPTTSVVNDNDVPAPVTAQPGLHVPPPSETLVSAAPTQPTEPGGPGDDVSGPNSVSDTNNSALLLGAAALCLGGICAIRKQRQA